MSLELVADNSGRIVVNGYAMDTAIEILGVLENHLDGCRADALFAALIRAVCQQAEGDLQLSREIIARELRQTADRVEGNPTEFIISFK